jgi:hypothetical protein
VAVIAIIALIVYLCYRKINRNRNNGRVISNQPVFYPLATFQATPQPFYPTTPVIYTNQSTSNAPPTHLPPLPSYDQVKNNPKFNDYSNSNKTVQIGSENNVQYPVLPEPFRQQAFNQQ